MTLSIQDALKLARDLERNASEGWHTPGTGPMGALLKNRQHEVVAVFPFEFGDDAHMAVRARNAHSLLLDIAEAAEGLGSECKHPIADSDGEGEWCTPVWIDCGECPECALAAALQAFAEHMGKSCAGK